MTVCLRATDDDDQGNLGVLPTQNFILISRWLKSKGDPRRMQLSMVKSTVNKLDKSQRYAVGNISDKVIKRGR